MAKTRFFRVAVEGATTDGRTIERKWLEDAAATYKPETYTARINMEHIRGFSPDAPFNAYGNVEALKTEEIILDVGGKVEKRLALFAQVDALDPLVELNRKGQKLFSSIEISPDFAGTGKAYLVGMAVTDSPASLGTEMLQFAASLGDKSPLAHRKLDKANLFTAAEEVSIEFEPVAPAADQAGMFASVKAFFDKLNAKPEVQQQSQTPPEDQPPVAPQADGFAALGVLMGQMAAGMEAAQASFKTATDKLTTDLAALGAKVEALPASPFTHRPPATGGDGGAKTDC